MTTLKSTPRLSHLRLVPSLEQGELQHIEQEQTTPQDLTINLVYIQRDQEIEAPAHYISGRTIQPIEVLEDWDLEHHLACALKYIARAGRKHDEVKDLKKAMWYLERRINLLEQQE